MPTARRSHWVLPAFTFALGALVGAAEWIGGDPAGGAKSFAMLAVVGVVLLIGGSSETIALMRSPDERWRALDRRATAFTAFVLIAVLIGAWLWEVAHGRSGQPYVGLASTAGVAYIVAMVYLRFRG